MALYTIDEMKHANLKDEEEHLDWIQAKLEQIRQLGLQNYPVERTDGVKGVNHAR